MTPLTNAVLGLLFLSVGLVATVLMFYLRGHKTGKKSKRDNEPPVPTAKKRKSPSAAARPAPSTGSHAPKPISSREKDSARPASSGTTEKTETVWYKVAEADEVPEGGVVAATAGTQPLALTCIDGQYGAIDGLCPHQGGPLSEGTIEDGLLLCPWHGRGFDPKSGRSQKPNHEDAAAFQVDVREDGIYVAIEQPVQPTPTVADVMVETMVNWGVRHVFGMVGHSNLGVAEAIRKQEAKGNLTYIGIRHEGAASFACSAYAKLSGKPAACLTIAGPGATNLLTGLWDAHVDRAPVLAMTGQINTQVVGPGTFQEIDQVSAFAAVAAWSQTVLTSSNHVELMNLALKHAIVERGVAHLIFPDEVQTMPVPEAKPSDSQGRLGQIAIAPPPQSIDLAVDLIARSHRPAIIVGYGAREAMPKVVALAEQLTAPVLTTFKAKGQISDDHPLGGGVIGRSGTPVAGSLMSQADLLIVFGASFADHTGIDRSKQIIQVDYERLALGRFHPVTVPVWGEIAVTAEILRERLPAESPGVDIREELAQRQSDWREEKRKRAAQDGGQGVNSAAIFAALTRQAPSNAVMPVDVGNNTYSFGRYFECKNQSILMSGYLGSIGFGLPAALGAWAAAPDRPIISVSGDGGFGQYMGEFTTAVKYGMNITHILLNNNELAKISLEQREGQWPVWQTSLVNPNFAEFAELCGGYGVRVTRADELDEAITAALEHKGPALVEIMADGELT
ncbi:MAG: Rieske 2Fe-2S domain-containing protein [Pirellulales bacterium]|nr:Rieske 2Fe-2S domain-containing protein [Pirellulales bacterium]